MTATCPACGDVTDPGAMDVRWMGRYVCRCGQLPRVLWHVTEKDRQLLSGYRIASLEQSEAT